MDIDHDRMEVNTSGGELVKAIYVVGAPRSGSTLLGFLLGSQPGVEFIGETIRLASQWREDRVCGCGESLRSCVFWRAVSTTVELGTFSEHDIPALHDVVHERGAQVVVDTSKDASYVKRIARPHDLIVHLVRDPRAYALSSYQGWTKKREEGHPRFIKVLRTSASWLRRNATGEGLRRRFSGIRIRYEDLCERPDAVRRDVLERLGLQAVERDWGSQHPAGGNAPVKRRGQSPIRLDDAWRYRLPRRHQVAAYLLTLPLSRSYGYPVSERAPYPPRNTGA
jgi:hypothetical protein